MNFFKASILYLYFPMLIMAIFGVAAGNCVGKTRERDMWCAHVYGGPAATHYHVCKDKPDWETKE